MAPSLIVTLLPVRELWELPSTWDFATTRSLGGGVSLAVLVPTLPPAPSQAGAVPSTLRPSSSPASLWPQEVSGKFL